VVARAAGARAAAGASRLVWATAEATEAAVRAAAKEAAVVRVGVITFVPDGVTLKAGCPIASLSTGYVILCNGSG
jgi:plastocyanin